MVRTAWSKCIASCSGRADQRVTTTRREVMRAAIYARVSTERQEREQTIESQLTALQHWVQLHQHSLNPTHIYRDEGYSGARLDRPGLDALRDAAADGASDVVAVLHPDRIARKYAYQVVLL